MHPRNIYDFMFEIRQRCMQTNVFCLCRAQTRSRLSPQSKHEHWNITSGMERADVALTQTQESRKRRSAVCYYRSRNVKNIEYIYRTIEKKQNICTLFRLTVSASCRYLLPNVYKAGFDASLKITSAALSLGELVDFGPLHCFPYFAENTRPQMVCRIDALPFANQAGL